MKISFGKYKGMFLTELPTEYLKWLIDTVEIREPLNEEVQKEYNLRLSEYANDSYYNSEFQYKHREEFSEPPPLKKSYSPKTELALSMIRKGFLELARKNHPDRGGNIDTMKDIIQTKDRLITLVEKYFQTLF